MALLQHGRRAGALRLLDIYWTFKHAYAPPANAQPPNPTQAIVYGGDWMQTYDSHVTEVLAAGKPVLVYAGMEDFMCNYVVRYIFCFVLGSGHIKHL